MIYEAKIKWVDQTDDVVFDVLISTDGVDKTDIELDDSIFYYFDDEDSIKSHMKKNNGEEFYILEYNERKTKTAAYKNIKREKLLKQSVEMYEQPDDDNKLLNPFKISGTITGLTFLFRIIVINLLMMGIVELKINVDYYIMLLLPLLWLWVTTVWKRARAIWKEKHSHYVFTYFLIAVIGIVSGLFGSDSIMGFANIALGIINLVMVFTNAKKEI